MLILKDTKHCVPRSAAMSVEPGSAEQSYEYVTIAMKRICVDSIPLSVTNAVLPGTNTVMQIGDCSDATESGVPDGKRSGFASAVDCISAAVIVRMTFSPPSDTCSTSVAPKSVLLIQNERVSNRTGWW